MRISAFTSRAALSFAEIMICVLLLGIGLIPTFYVFSRGNVGTMMTRDEILAHTYAGELIDYAQALGFENLPATGEEGKRVNAIQIGDKTLKISGAFERRLFIVPGETTECDKEWPYSYKIVRAEVHWRSGEVPQRYVQSSLVFLGKVSK